MKRLALACAMLAAGCASAPVATVKPGHDFSKVRRVALLGFDDFPRQRGSGAAVASVFEKYLLQAGYSVVERRQVKDVLKEHSLGVSGAVDPRTARRLGKLLGVDALILGSITAFSPARQETVLRDHVEERRDPVTRQVTRRRKVGDEWVTTTSEEVVGYNVSRTVRSVPEPYTVYAQVGLAARMVDVDTGEVLWVGSSSDSGLALDDAADSASRRILNAVKKTWPSRPR